MIKSSKTYIAKSLLLIGFLLVLSKGIHFIKHTNDVHCNEKVLFHLHEVEHECSLCDFILLPFLSVKTFSLTVFTVFLFITYSVELTLSILLPVYYFNIYRGPPILLNF